MTDTNVNEPSVATEDHGCEECCDVAAFKARYYIEGPSSFAEHMAFPDATLALKRLAEACSDLPFNRSWGTFEFKLSDSDEYAFHQAEELVAAFRAFAGWLENKIAGYKFFTSEGWVEYSEDSSDIGGSMGSHTLFGDLEKFGNAWRVDVVNLWDTCIVDELDCTEEGKLLSCTAENLFLYRGMVGYDLFKENQYDYHFRHED